MKLYEIVIKPTSFFRTPLKGDTIFGHFIWQLIYKKELLKVPFKDVISEYKTNPFVVISSAYPRIYKDGESFIFVKRPDLPMDFWMEPGLSQYDLLKDRKKFKKKDYLQIKEDLKVNCNRNMLCSEKDIYEIYRQEYKFIDEHDRPEKIKIEFRRIHNKINRLTSSTGENFSPYSQDQVAFLPFLELSIFILYNEEVISKDAIYTAFESMGQMGFGRDASTGFGRFTVCEDGEIDMPDYSGCHGLFTLSPCVIKREYKNIYFQPFVRFGRHGGFYAVSKNPFKNPVLMLNEGAVIVSEEENNTPYVGTGLSGLSKVEENTVSQGYSIVLPLYFRNL